MKDLYLLIIACVLLPQAASSQTAGKGENIPTVQSALGGSYYVRSIPSEDFGSKGKTQVLRVRNSGDELLDEYPVLPSVYEGGTLFGLESNSGEMVFGSFGARESIERH